MPVQLNGGSYGLRQVSTSDKTVLLMKLTDSALRIIENYQDNSGGGRRQPSIQFHGSQGEIQIPAPGGSGGDQDYQTFTFQVSNLSQSAGVDCLQQIHTGQTGRIESLGSVRQKITVNATDDSYNMTRKRMTLAKEEEQKISTKVIKQPSSSKIGKVFKKRTGKGRIMEKQQNHTVGKMSPDTRPHTPPLSHLNQSVLNRSSSPLTLPIKDRATSPPGVPGSGRNKTKPTISISSAPGNSSAGSMSSGVSGNATVASRPLWDRVAHLLAVRPYKYPEIVLRLSRDKAPDKSRLQTILQQVASSRNIQGSGPEYCLSRSSLLSIDLDWPGYSESDRKIVKKKLADANSLSESRKRPYSSGVSPSQGQSHTEDDEYSNPQIKKQRVSHYKKPSPTDPLPGPPVVSSPPREISRSKATSPANSAGISFSTAKLPSKGHGGDARSRNHVNPKPSKNLPYPADQGFVDAPHQDLKRPSEPSSPKRSPSKSVKREKHHKVAVTQDAKNDEEDYKKKYIEISSVEQRDRYKSDFYAEYQEYLCHHSNVAAVSEKFAELQRKLNAHKKGSEEYKAISKQVFQEYKRTKKNDNYHHERSRMQFLHRKLQHIKLLVNDFDRHKLANRSENDPGRCMQAKTATRVA